MNTMKINELISELKEYDGELTVKVFSNGADKADPKRYSRSLAQFFVAATTAYIILSLFYAITKYILL